MATMIDSLFVSLKLDSSQFKSGTKDVELSLKKTGENAAKANKTIEESSKKAGDSLRVMRTQVIALAAAYVGFGAIKSFIKDTITQGAALQRLSASFGMSAKSLAQYELAAKRTGAAAGSVTNALRGMHDTVARAQQGQITPSLSAMGRYGAEVNLPVNYQADAQGMAMQAADIIQNLVRTKGANYARMAASDMGITEDLFELFSQGSAALRKALAAQEKNAEEQVKMAAQSAELTRKLADLSNAFDKLKMQLFNELMPSIEDFVAYMGSDDAKVAMKALADTLITLTKGMVTFGKAIGHLAAKIFGYSGVDSEHTQWSANLAVTPGTKLPNGKIAGGGTASSSASVVTSQAGTTKRAGGSSMDATRVRLMQQLMAGGLKEHEAAGVVGNMERESGLNYRAENKKSKMYGLIQWSKTRQALYKKQFKKDLRDASESEQIEFLLWELKNTEKYGMKKLRETDNARAAGFAFSKHVERPEDHEVFHADRGNFAVHALQAMHAHNMSGASNLAMHAGIGASAATGGNVTNSTVSINNLNINTQATDANGIAREMPGAINRNMIFGLPNANTGVM